MNRWNWYRYSVCRSGQENKIQRQHDMRRSFDYLCVCKLCHRTVSLDANFTHNSVGFDLLDMEEYPNGMSGDMDSTQFDSQNRHYEKRHPYSEKWGYNRFIRVKLPKKKEYY